MDVVICADFRVNLLSLLTRISDYWNYYILPKRITWVLITCHSFSLVFGLPRGLETINNYKNKKGKKRKKLKTSNLTGSILQAILFFLHIFEPKKQIVGLVEPFGLISKYFLTSKQRGKNKGRKIRNKKNEKKDYEK